MGRGLADDGPVSLGLSWHPAPVLSGLLEQRSAGLSVKQACASHGIGDYDRKRTEIFARRPDREEARLLVRNPDQPVLVVVKTDVAPDDGVIGHSEAIWAAVRVRFAIDSLEAGDA